MAALPVRRSGRNTSLVNPSREFEDIYDRMGQLMNFAFGDLARVEMPWVPLADLSETEDAYVAKVELPGVGKDQIDVQLAVLGSLCWPVYSASVAGAGRGAHPPTS